MEKTIEIPEGYEARIEGGKVIFERKESEDERIREAIESIIRVYGKTQGEWIAGYDMDTLVVHLRDAFAYLERQKEQQPAGWSEEDEEMIARICANLEYLIKEAGCDSKLKEKLEERIKWMKRLKSLRHQPKAEWSEKDKNALMYLHELISFGFTDKFFDAQTANDMREWLDTRLESLRDNYKKCNSHWKPSEEQMAALLNAEGLVRANNYPENAKILASLYTDLKKL